MKLTDHFTLEELTASDTAARKGIDNSVPHELMPNMKRLAKFMEDIRHKLHDHVIVVSSGYRCPDLNKAIGGVTASAHMNALATDFICPGFGTPYQIVETLSPLLEDYDQIIHEFGRWVHLGLSNTFQRREILTARYDRQLKKTVYMRGLHHA